MCRMQCNLKQRFHAAAPAAYSQIYIKALQCGLEQRSPAYSQMCKMQCNLKQRFHAASAAYSKWFSPSWTALRILLHQPCQSHHYHHHRSIVNVNLIGNFCAVLVNEEILEYEMLLVIFTPFAEKICIKYFNRIYSPFWGVTVFWFIKIPEANSYFVLWVGFLWESKLASLAIL